MNVCLLPCQQPVTCVRAYVYSFKAPGTAVLSLRVVYVVHNSTPGLGDNYAVLQCKYFFYIKTRLSLGVSLRYWN